MMKGKKKPMTKANKKAMISKMIKTFKDIAIDETLKEMQENKTNLLDNPFRLGSMMYFEIIKEARKLSQNKNTD